jgi:anti-anti-sigma factor
MRDAAGTWVGTRGSSLPSTAVPHAIGDPMTAAHAAPAFFQAAAETNPTVVRRVGSTIARLRGNLDFTTAPAVRERLRELVSTSAKLLVIDLSGVSSSDAAGLAVLIGAQRRARARGITVCLAAPRTEVAELLRVTGLDSTLTICATLTDALPGGGTSYAPQTSSPRPITAIRAVRRGFRLSRGEPVGDGADDDVGAGAQDGG